MKTTIRQFNEAVHSESVIQLWETVFGYPTAHNNPALSIQKKVAQKDGLFFVAENEAAEVLGTVMCGYDGHRGWIYALAVQPDKQCMGVGSQLMSHAENELASLGCMKVNLQIMEGNDSVEQFYQSLGYHTEKRISMGKRIEDNIPK